MFQLYNSQSWSTNLIGQTFQESMMIFSNNNTGTFHCCITPLICVRYIKFQFLEQFVSLKMLLYLLWVISQSLHWHGNMQCSILLWLLWDLFSLSSKNNQNIWLFYVGNVSYLTFISCLQYCCIKPISHSQSSCYTEYQQGCDQLWPCDNETNLVLKILLNQAIFWKWLDLDD